MKIRKTIIKQLRERLPRGSAMIIKLRLEDRGINFSREYIYRVLDPQNRDYNTIIIDEAIILAQELSRKVAKKERKIVHLRKAVLWRPLVPCPFPIKSLPCKRMNIWTFFLKLYLKDQIMFLR